MHTLLLSRVQSPPAPLSVPVELPAAKGASQGKGMLVLTLPFFPAPSQGHKSCPDVCFFFFFSFLPVYMGIFLTALLYKKFSDSYQWVFCENFSTSRYIFYKFIGVGEFHVLVLCQLDPLRLLFFFLYFFILFTAASVACGSSQVRG